MEPCLREQGPMQLGQPLERLAAVDFSSGAVLQCAHPWSLSGSSDIGSHSLVQRMLRYDSEVCAFAVPSPVGRQCGAQTPRHCAGCLGQLQTS
jgi:hypothetical protein